jgi:FkbM family methyltransferase
MILEVWYEQVYTGKFFTPSPEDTIIDAGANIGLFSILIARAQPACRVFAFEPFDENFRLMQANLASASATNVYPFQIALSGESGTCEMSDGGTRSQDHRLVGTSSSKSATIPTASFAEVLDCTGPGPVALFKCDIEGSEYDLFRTAESRDIQRVRRFAIEYHNNIRPGTTELIRDRLKATHILSPEIASSDAQDGYGMLYATAKTL